MKDSRMLPGETRLQMFERLLLNPITGFREDYCNKVTGSGFLKSQSAKSVQSNGFKNNFI